MHALKTILLLAVFAVVTTRGVCAFELVEGIPLHSNAREEARINANWLVLESTKSTLSGFLAHYPGNNSGRGRMDVFFEGHDYLGHYHSLEGNATITDVWNATCYPLQVDCYHYNGTSLVEIDDGMYMTAFSGFYNPQSKQIYVHYDHENLGVTWANFVNQPFLEEAIPCQE